MFNKLNGLENKAIVLMVILLLITSIIAFSSIERYLGRSVTDRAFFELESVSVEQVSLICTELKRQTDPLYLVADMLDDSGFDIDNIETISKMIDNNEWCMVGFADLSGHAVNYDGSDIGNIGERNYYKNIITGRSNYQIEYLSETYLTTEPRFIISVPMMKDNQIKGVIFASKEVSILEPVLLGDANKDEDTIIMMASSDGAVLSSNNSAKKIFRESNIFNNCSDDSYLNGSSEKEIIKSLKTNSTGTYQYINSDDEIEDVFYTPLGVNDWYLFSAIDESKAELKYESNMIILKKLILVIIVSFYILLGLITVIYLIYINNIKKKEEELRFEKKRSDIMLSEMGCELVVYDINSGRVSTDGALHEKYQFDFSDTLSDLVSKQNHIHPECDFERLIKAIDRVILSKASTEFVFPLEYNKKIQWIKLLLIPYFSESMVVTHVFGAFINITKEHESFERSAELLSFLPGGLRRMKLNKPYETEYISDGLTKMLGYSSDEFGEKMSKADYRQFICESDREKYDIFIAGLTEKPSICSCEYSVICSNGELMPVSDTTESIESPNGNIYGYSVVMDISSFKEKDKVKDEEIKNAKETIIKKQLIEKSLQEDQKKLITATRSVYTEIVSINLSKNSYYVMNFDGKGTEEGVFDDYISQKAGQIVDKKQRSLFENKFDRNLLIKSFHNDDNNVIKLRHKQADEDGIIHWIDTKVILLEQNDEGDIMAMSLTKNADEEQRWIDNIIEMRNKEKAYHDAIIANSVGFMEINITSGLLLKYSLDNIKDIPDIKKISERFIGTDYDHFEKWWADSMAVSGKEVFLKTCNCKYLMSQYLKGFRYEEVVCKSILPSGKEVYWRRVFYFSENKTSGDIIAFCVLYDISEQERSKREIKELSNELKESRIKNSISQMQPHFLYNTLASIREIILEEPQYASDLICDFTTHLRACIRLLSNNEIVPFSKELENINAYVNIEKMRFGSKLKVNYNIEFDNFYVVPLGIQPLVENAIRHGIYKRGPKGGTVTISTYKDEEAHYISVKDNGVGFEYNGDSEGQIGRKDSTGLNNLTFRLEKMLNASTSINSSIEEGTEVVVRIPIPKEGA